MENILEQNISSEGNRLFDNLRKLSNKKQARHLYDFHSSLTEEAQERPFFTINFGDILWKNQLWKENFPNIFPYYAVKANPDSQLLRLYTLLGYGFDCSTEGEIRHVLKAGCAANRIIFAHTVKTVRALQWAKKIGLHLMTFDSREELIKIQKHHPKAKLVLRIKSSSTQTLYNLSKKFGCDISEAEKLLLIAKDLKLEVVGVSFHVGALCEDPKTFTTSIDHARQVFDTAIRIGFNFHMIDIGAGFYGSTEREPFFYKLSREINASLEVNFPEKVEWIGEPGCFCVCSAGTLTTAIIGKKDRQTQDENQIQKEYYINDGFYGSFFENKEIYDVKPVPLLVESGVKTYRSRIWGQTCCSEDLVWDDSFLPDMEEGDLVVWENMGAYSSGCCSSFTSVPMPATEYVFVKDTRLKLKFIPNLEEVLALIAENSVLVENGSFRP